MLREVEKTDIKVTNSPLTAVDNIDIFQANNAIQKIQILLDSQVRNRWKTERAVSEI